jgi:hypothetical protein
MKAMEDERINTNVVIAETARLASAILKCRCQLCCESSSVGSAQELLLQQELNA